MNSGNVSKLAIEIVANDKGAITAIRKVGDEAENTGRRGRKGFDEAAGGVDRFNDKVRGMERALQDVIGAFSLLQGMRFLKGAIDETERYQNSLRGLASEARYSGEEIGSTLSAGSKLAADGLISITNAATALKNLLSRGFSLDQAIQMIDRLKDSASFGRQAALSMGQAVESATEGIKNENSILVDNAGVTKNVSIMWKEYAAAHDTTVDKMTLAMKREAEFSGIMRETAAQVGNAKLALDGITGAKAQLAQESLKLNLALGQSLTPTFITLTKTGVWMINNFVNPFIGGLEIMSVRVADFLTRMNRLGGRSLYDMMFGPKLDLSDLDAALEESLDAIAAKYSSVQLPALGADSGARRIDTVTNPGKEDVKAASKQAREDEKKLSEAMDRIKRKAAEIQTAQVEAAKAATDAWKEYQSAMDDLNTGVMTDHQRQVYDIEQRYADLEGKLVSLVETGRMTFEEADQWQAALKARMTDDLNDLYSRHDTTASEVETVWDSALRGMNSGLDEWERNGEMSAESVRNAFAGAIRGIVADWLKGMATMDARSAKMQSIGGTAGIYSTIAGSDSGYGGLLSAGVGVVNELFNPGAYGASLGTMKTGLEIGLAKYGFEGAADSLHLMSSNAFGAGTAGLGTFAVNLLSGKDFAQSAAEGAASGIGFALGSMTPLGPIGGMIGSAIATALTGSLFGDKEKEFSLNELNPHIDSRYSRGAGLDAPSWTEPDGTRPTTTYLNAIDQLQNQMETKAAQLGDAMSEVAAEAFFTALEAIDLTPDADGRWGVGQTQEALTEILTNYGVKLDASLSAAVRAALPLIADEMMGANSSFALLTDQMQGAIRGMIGSDSFGLDQLSQLQSYLNQISQAMAPIDEILATKGFTEHQLALRSVNQEFAAYRAELQAAGIDLAKDTRLMEAWAIALDKVNAAERVRIATLELDQANDQLSLATTILNNSFAAERNRLTQEHSGLLADLNRDLSIVNGTISELGRSISAIHNAKISMDLGTTDFARGSYSTASGVLAEVLAAARAGDFSSLNRLDDLLSTLARPNQELYATSAEFERDYWKTYLALAEIESLTGDQLSTDEQVAKSLEQQIEIENSHFDQQMTALDAQLNALLGINTSVMTLAGAIANYQGAKNLVADATTKVGNAGLSAEQLYLQTFPDVAAAVAAGQFKSGAEHFAQYGLYENRTYGHASVNSAGLTPEQLYIQAFPDVAAAVAAGQFKSGADHYAKYGQYENRIYGFATGGVHAGGWRVVGEQGPELEYTGASQIYSNQQSKALVDFSGVIAELQRIRRAVEEMDRNTQAIASSSSRTAKIAERDSLRAQVNA